MDKIKRIVFAAALLLSLVGGASTASADPGTTSDPTGITWESNGVTWEESFGGSSFTAGVTWEE